MLWVIHAAIFDDVLHHGRNLGLVETHVAHIALASVVLVIRALDAAEIFICSKLLMWDG